MSSKDFDIPDDVQGLARQAAERICEVIRRTEGREPHGGGCSAFRSPESWKARGERYGTGSVLIVVHDGGDAAQYFNADYEDHRAVESMRAELEKIGLYPEQCTSWYSAIYRTGGAER